MRLIGVIAEPREAESFVAYLVTLGILAKGDRVDENKTEIWVHEEDQVQSAQTELAGFLANPGDAKYSRSVSQAQQILRQQEDKRKRIQKKIVVGKRKLEPRPQVTIVLIVISVIVALFTNFGEVQNGFIFRALAFNAVPQPESLEIIRDSRGNLDDLNVRLASLKRGEIWRPITPIFIHHGTMHLLFNMLWLFQLGKMIELRYGKSHFLILVLVSAAISNLVQCMVPLRWDGVPSDLTGPDLVLLCGLGGFSGVVYALFGFVWVKSVLDPRSRFMLPPTTIAIMLIWLIFCMLPGPNGSSLTELFGFRVANWAHAVGLVVGILAAFVPEWKRKK